MYYRARYYDPAVGRFLSEDPLGFAVGDANLSRYVGNDPANWVDPSGMIWGWFAGVVGAVGGAVVGGVSSIVVSAAQEKWPTSEDARFIATGRRREGHSAVDVVTLFDRQDGERIEWSTSDSVCAIKFLCDGQHVVVATTNGLLRVWRIPGAEAAAVDLLHDESESATD